MAKTISKKKSQKFKPHKSFKRSYREDYAVEDNSPSVLQQLIATCKILFKNWKLFLPLLIIIVLLNILFIGLMSSSEYNRYQSIIKETSEQVNEEIGVFPKAGLLLVSTITTGGLFNSSSEVTGVFSAIIFLITWLVTIYLLRHILAGHKVKLRDGLYNAMTPLISTFVVFAVLLIQCIPALFLVIAYSAAVQTDFLSTPFYALLFFVFAALMIILTSYLVSSSLIALVAVSAPGLYPFYALRTASELMSGRRINFIIRLLGLIIFLLVVWAVIMIPIIMLDLWLKSFEWAANIPFVPICLVIMTSLTCIYSTAYLYLYYRGLLDYEKN